MKIARTLFLGFVGIIVVFLGYLSLSGTSPDSFNVLSLEALPAGPIKSTEKIDLYNGSDSSTAIYEGIEWKADRFLHMEINSGVEQYPGVTFKMKQPIPPEAQLVIQWRQKGTSQRVLIDITDGPASSTVPQTGENYFVYADVPGESWTTSTFPLEKFERNPFQPTSAPNDGHFDTEGIQGVSLTFFPHSHFTLEIKEIRFIWRSHQATSILYSVMVFLIGLLLWWRTTKDNLTLPGRRDINKNTMIARGVFVLLALAVFAVINDQEMILYNIRPLFTFGILLLLIIVDDFIKARWTQSTLWSYRYIAVLLAAWYLNVTHNPVLIVLFMTIAALPTVFEKSRYVFFSLPVIAIIGLLTHPEVVLLSTLLPGIVMILVVTIFIGLVHEIIEHTKAQREAKYVQSLYEEVLESSSDSIYILDKRGNITAANREFEILLSRPSDEIIGRNIREFVHIDDHPLIDVDRQESFNGGVTRNYDLRFLQKSGNVRTALVREILVSKDPYETRFQIIATDITERKLAEAERERLVQELQNALAEVRTLSGLLPICASCKKIRDDRGYWTQLEGYIQAHSDAKFTHGICPDCMKELYPDFTPDVLGSGLGKTEE